MKKLLLILLCLPILTLAQKTYIPDDNFENYLEANGMGDGVALNDSVFTSAIDTLTVLEVAGLSIADLTGIEDFIILDSLRCQANQLTSLDLSTNTALVSLVCHTNLLTSLDVSQNTALTYLICSYNQLTSLDVSQNTALDFFRCENNQLTSIDLSNNIDLQLFYADHNQLTSLDVSNNINLWTIHCDSNQLTAIDVSNNNVLNYLWLRDNNITSLDVSANPILYTLLITSNQIASLDLSNNPTFENLDCENNNLNWIDLRNGNNQLLQEIHTINNPSLDCILVDNPAYSAANWVGGSFEFDVGTLFSVFCTPQTQIPDVNFESYLEANGMGNGMLGDDSVSTINISSVANLNVGGLNISDLTGIEDFSLLQYLDCSNNNLTDLDVSNNTQLSNLQCEANILNTLSFDVGLTSLDCFNNQLTSLDLSNNSNLTFLNCSYNNLNWLDLRNGNNQLLINPNFTGNPYLSCINVDDPPTSGPDWPWDDPWSVYGTTCDPINSWNCVGNDCLGDSIGTGMYTVLGDCQANCGISSVLDNDNNPAKELIKVIDVLGRHTEHTKEIILFYLFDDGTVEKRIVIE